MVVTNQPSEMPDRDTYVYENEKDPYLNDVTEQLQNGFERTTGNLLRKLSELGMTKEEFKTHKEMQALSKEWKAWRREITGIANEKRVNQNEYNNIMRKAESVVAGLEKIVQKRDADALDMTLAERAEKHFITKLLDGNCYVGYTRYEGKNIERFIDLPTACAVTMTQGSGKLVKKHRYLGTDRYYFNNGEDVFLTVSVPAVQGSPEQVVVRFLGDGITPEYQNLDRARDAYMGTSAVSVADPAPTPEEQEAEQTLRELEEELGGLDEPIDLGDESPETNKSNTDLGQAIIDEGKEVISAVGGAVEHLASYLPREEEVEVPELPDVDPGTPADNPFDDRYEDRPAAEFVTAASDEEEAQMITGVVADTELPQAEYQPDFSPATAEPMEVDGPEPSIVAESVSYRRTEPEESMPQSTATEAQFERRGPTRTPEGSTRARTVFGRKAYDKPIGPERYTAPEETAKAPTPVPAPAEKAEAAAAVDKPLESAQSEPERTEVGIDIENDVYSLASLLYTNIREEGTPEEILVRNAFYGDHAANEYALYMDGSGDLRQNKEVFGGGGTFPHNIQLGNDRVMVSNFASALKKDPYDALLRLSKTNPDTPESAAFILRLRRQLDQYPSREEFMRSEILFKIFEYIRTNKEQQQPLSQHMLVALLRFGSAKERYGMYIDDENNLREYDAFDTGRQWYESIRPHYDGIIIENFVHKFNKDPLGTLKILSESSSDSALASRTMLIIAKKLDQIKNNESKRDKNPGFSGEIASGEKDPDNGNS